MRISLILIALFFSGIADAQVAKIKSDSLIPLATNIQNQQPFKTPGNPNDYYAWVEHQPDKIDSNQLINVLINEVLAGKLHAYRSIADTKSMSIADVKIWVEQGGGVDTISVMDNSGNTKIKTVELSGLKNVTELRFIEDWYFDTSQMQFIKKVKAVGIMQEKNLNGTFIGFYPAMFILF